MKIARQHRQWRGLETHQNETAVRTQSLDRIAHGVDGVAGGEDDVDTTRVSQSLSVGSGVQSRNFLHLPPALDGWNHCGLHRLSPAVWVTRSSAAASRLDALPQLLCPREGIATALPWVSTQPNESNG